jgi:hypothetical protein
VREATACGDEGHDCEVDDSCDGCGHDHRPNSVEKASDGTGSAAAAAAAATATANATVTVTPSRTHSGNVNAPSDSELNLGLASCLWDSHTHARSAVGLNIGGAALMSVAEQDWARVSRATSSGTGSSESTSIEHNVVGCYGIHPWQAHNAKPGWEDRLVAKLRHHPRAAVGEIGLDKAARTCETGKCEFATQKEVFRCQLRIAGQLQRSVSPLFVVGKFSGRAFPCSQCITFGSPCIFHADSPCKCAS